VRQPAFREPAGPSTTRKALLPESTSSKSSVSPLERLAPIIGWAVPAEVTFVGRVAESFQPFSFDRRWTSVFMKALIRVRSESERYVKRCSRTNQSPVRCNAVDRYHRYSLGGSCRRLRGPRCRSGFPAPKRSDRSGQPARERKRHAFDFAVDGSPLRLVRDDKLFPAATTTSGRLLLSTMPAVIAVAISRQGNRDRTACHGSAE